MRALCATGCCIAALASIPAGAAGNRGAWRVQALPAGASFSEPGIAAGRGGALIANACTANAGGPATFWRSADSGRTWSRGFPVGTSAIGCGDADAAIGSDGFAYALVLGTGVSVYRSRDGKQWSGPASFPPPHGEDQPDRPWLVTVPSRPDIVYLFNSEVGGNVVVWTSTDHAATFTGPTPVTGGINSEAALTIGSRPLVDPRHPARLRMFYETSGLGGVPSSVGGAGPTQFPFTQLWQAASTDGGRSWSNTLVLDLAAAFGQTGGTLGHLLPATAVDRNGTAYVVMSVQLGSGSATHLYLLHSLENGEWSRPVRIDRAGASNVYPALAVSRTGRVFVSWYGSDAGTFTDARARWHEYVASSRNALSARPHFDATTLGPVVHVGAIEQAGAVGSDLGENWSLRDFQSVIVDACGRPHVIWAADYPKAGRVLTATTAACA